MDKKTFIKAIAIVITGGVLCAIKIYYDAKRYQDKCNYKYSWGGTVDVWGNK